MRRTPALVAVTVLAAAGLVGCSASAEPVCPPAPAQTGLIQATGDIGSAPQISVRAPFHTDRTTAQVLEQGEGNEIVSGRQAALIDVTVVSGETGETLVGTQYASQLAKVPSVFQLSQTFPALPAALECATEGSRVAVALSPDDLTPETVTGLGLETGETAVLVVDVRRVYLPRADGTDQYAESHGLPTVVRAPDGRPGIIVPDADAPSEVVVQTIKRGDGPEATAAALLRLHVTGVDWTTGSEFFTTWSEEPRPVILDALSADTRTGLVPGLADALIGQTVGSQVLVVLPADATGAGDAAKPGVPSGAALVYVVDILGSDQ